MHKLYFRYGTMNSSKTANLLMVAHNYKSQNKKVFCIKPVIDIRFGQQTIASRALPEMITADLILLPDVDEINVPIGTDCVLVDEAQFLSDVNVDALRLLSNTVPVICYGLRTDYKSHLFPGSKRLFELADTIEEIKTVCVNCTKKAIINSKFYTQNNKKIIIREGNDLPDLGKEDKYMPLCWFCWTNL